MVASAPVESQRQRHWRRRARALGWFGLAWHVAEGAIAIALGVAASSVALVGFGADSFIEAAAAIVIIWRLARPATDLVAERRASRAIAVSFYVLAVYVVFESTRVLILGEHPGESLGGIVLAAVTAMAMPPLALAKQRAAREIDSCATRSEGRQNMVCAYLSVALLLGLGANAAFGWWWADPVVAFAIAGVAVREGREAWRGQLDCCA